MLRPAAVLLLAAVLAPVLLAPPARAQAPTGFVDISTGPSGVPMVRNASDVAVAPDGTLYASSLFRTGPLVGSPGVARRVGNAWVKLPGVFSVEPTRIEVAPDGALWAAGTFRIDGGPVLYVARFDGTAWSDAGAAFNSQVTGLAIETDGTVVVTGSFSTVNGATAWYAAQFRGGVWGAIAGAPTPSVDLLLSAREPVADGAAFYVPFVRRQFTQGPSELRLARVAGGAWADSGVPLPAELLAAGPAGQLYATRPTVFSGQTAYPVFQYTGGAWVTLVGTFPRPVEALAVAPDGTLHAATVTTLNTNSSGTATLFRRAGTGWAAIGAYAQVAATSINASLRYAFAGTTLYAAGNFLEMSGQPATYVGRYDGAAWSPLGSETDNRVRALATGPGGDVYAAGEFTRVQGTFVGASALSAGLARWDGAVWRPVGAPPNDIVSTVSQVPDGALLACGSFTQIGGVAARRVARWDGAAWTPFGAGLGSAGSGSGTVSYCAQAPDGTVYASGGYGAPNQDLVSRWNGSAWTTIATLNTATNGQVTALAVGLDGALVVSGSFTSIEGVAAARVARYAGGAWSALGAGLNQRAAVLATGPDGEIAAGGFFTTAGGAPAARVARWTGTAWQPYGTGLPRSVYALAFGPDGTLYAATEPTGFGGVLGTGAARWDGAAWTDVTPGGTGFDNFVTALVVDARGDLVLGGDFQSVNTGTTSATQLRSPFVVRFDGPVRARVTGPAGYRMLAPPATGQTLGSLLAPVWTQGFPGADAAGGAPNVFVYDEAAPGGVGAGFGPPASASVPAAPGAGVFAFVYEDADYTTPGVQGGFPRPFEFPAAPPAPPLAFPVSYTPTPDGLTPADDGWNLLGNPFAGVLDWDTLTRASVDATVYAYDPAYLGGGYRVWNGTTGSLAGGLLAPMQGFWAHATAAGASLSAPSAALAFAAPAARGAAAGTLRVEVRDAAGTPEAEAFVSVSPEGTLAVDALDGYALDPIRSEFVRLATEPAAGGAERLAIQSLPDAFAGEVALPLVAEAVGGAPRALALAWDAAVLPAGWSARIVDTATGASASMDVAGTLPFSAVPLPATDGAPALRRASSDAARGGAPARFQVVVARAATGAETGPPGGLTLAVGPNPARGAATAFVSGAAGEQTVEVLDALGRRVVCETVTAAAGRREVALPAGLAPGVYVVRVTAGGEARSVRLVVVR